MHIDLTGKTALVSASTAGIGLATADGAAALIAAEPRVDILVNTPASTGRRTSSRSTTRRGNTSSR